jgi:hypothetical protein
MVVLMSVVGCGGRGDTAEVSVFEPVGVAFEGDDLGVMDEPVDHGGGDHVVAEGLAPPACRAGSRDTSGWDGVTGRGHLGWCAVAPGGGRDPRGGCDHQGYVASDRTSADGRTFHSELIWLRV